jgi:hypothetical protein
MILYAGIMVKTATIQGSMMRLNFETTNDQLDLLLNEPGIKYPEMKKSMNITKISRYILIKPIELFLMGSLTIQLFSSMGS